MKIITKFLEKPRFPSDINYGLVGGPQYQTQILEQFSGWDQANSVWSYPKYQYQLSYSAKDIPIVEELLNFFHAVKGRAYGFRFQDPNDYKSCSITQEISKTDQKVIGIVDGRNTCFQLAKIYSVGDNDQLATIRPIHKPVLDTVQVAINGITDNRWHCDYTNGQLIFKPDETEAITALSYDASKEQLILSAVNNLVAGDSVFLKGMSELPALNQQRFVVIAATPETITIVVPGFEGADSYAGTGCFHTLPQTGEIVTAGFEFDVPVRFASDSLSISSDSYQVSSIQQLSLIEIRV
jgi:uncharacterized protein (TIGR02217 family)